MNDDAPSPESTDETTSTAQVGLVVLAALALVVAAFLVPVVAPSGGAGSGESDSTGGPGGDDSTDSPDGTFDWYELLEWFLPENDGEPTRTEPRCSIGLDRQPEPGGEVTAKVSYEGESLADASVWFNGERVGTTNANGEVTGTVPYERELTIRVDVPGRPDCRASTGSVRRSGSPDLSSPAGFPTLSVAAAAQQTATPNASVTYPVDGTVTVDVRGRPYPGDTLTVKSAIDGRPFRGAEVFVDGESVGETDDDGTATVAVPEDGTERFRVRVVRGDFAGSERVDVLLLSASLRPENLLALPGTEGDVLARLGDDPTEAAVFVGGERRGTTGADGRLTIDLPLDPTTTIAVETADQRATTSVASHYAVPAGAFALVVALLAAVAYRIRGRRGVATVAAGVAAVAAVVVADGLYGPTGRYAAIVAVVAAVVGITLYRWRQSITKGAATAGGTLRWLGVTVVRAATNVRRLPGLLRRLWASFVESAYRNALRVADDIGRLASAVATAVRRAAVRLRSLPRSASEFFERLRDGLRSMAGGIRRTVRNPIVLALAVAGAGATVVGYRVGGGIGAVLGAAATLVVAVALELRRRAADGSNSDDGPAAGETAPTEPAHVTDDGRSIRTLWRGFARLVAPNRWRSSTPEEIAAAAVEQGFPHRPVAELTRLFREVEYGDRPLSAAVRSRATDAYEAIRRRDRGEEQ
jgi:hypothetical protein